MNCVNCFKKGFLVKKCVTCPLQFCVICYNVLNIQQCDDCHKVYGKLYNIKQYFKS